MVTVASMCQGTVVFSVIVAREGTTLVTASDAGAWTSTVAPDDVESAVIAPVFPSRALTRAPIVAGPGTSPVRTTSTITVSTEPPESSVSPPAICGRVEATQPIAGAKVTAVPAAERSTAASASPAFSTATRTCHGRVCPAVALACDTRTPRTRTAAGAWSRSAADPPSKVSSRTSCPEFTSVPVTTPSTTIVPVVTPVVSTVQTSESVARPGSRVVPRPASAVGGARRYSRDTSAAVAAWTNERAVAARSRSTSACPVFSSVITIVHGACPTETVVRSGRMLRMTS